MRWLAMCVILFSGLLQSAFAQNKPGQTNTETAACTFQDGKQMSMRYEPPSDGKKAGLPLGELWPRSGSSMYLFTDAELTLGAVDIKPGAYSVHVIPEKEKWTLIINRNVTVGSPYDQQQDLVRHPMDIGQLDEPQPFQVAFAHVAPKQCNMRLYYGKTGTWTDFKEK